MQTISAASYSAMPSEFHLDERDRRILGRYYGLLDHPELLDEAVRRFQAMNGLKPRFVSILDDGREFEDVFIVKESLGSGLHGEVFRCIAKDGGAEFAVKVRQKPETAEAVIFPPLESFIRFSLWTITSTRIARHVRVVHTPTTCYRILELLRGHCLWDFLAEADTITERQVAAMTRAMADALTELHPSFFHRVPGRVVPVFKNGTSVVPPIGPADSRPCTIHGVI